MKHNGIILLTLLAVIYLFLYPKDAFLASVDGIRLWFNTVLPSLLPFLILSNFLIQTDRIFLMLSGLSNFFRIFLGLSVYGGYVLILGLFCGYPMGAKLCGELYQAGKIDSSEARYLLTFCNNASPAFIVSYILLNILQKPTYKLPTFLILYTSVFLTSFVFRLIYKRFHLKETIPYHPIKKKPYLSISRQLDQSIMNGFETITRLGGYILLFSIGASMITKFFSTLPMLGDILPGFVEITTGIRHIKESNLSFATQYSWILIYTSFGGISTLAQTKGMLNGTPLSLLPYVFGKLVNAFCTFVLTILFFIFIK